jgi:hypothetical protein
MVLVVPNIRPHPPVVPNIRPPSSAPTQPTEPTDQTISTVSKQQEPKMFERLSESLCQGRSSLSPMLCHMPYSHSAHISPEVFSQRDHSFTVPCFHIYVYIFVTSQFPLHILSYSLPTHISQLVLWNSTGHARHLTVSAASKRVSLN